MKNPNKSHPKPIVARTCEICGETFKGIAQRHQCDRCKRVYLTFYQRQSAALRRAGGARIGLENACTYATRMARAKVRGEEVAKRIEHEIRAAPGARCKYCGAKLSGPRVHYFAPSDGYCSRCRYFGLDNVHRVTGRTNGWDRRKT